MTTQEIIDAISALTEVVKVNNTPLGDRDAAVDANKKIIELMEKLA